MSSLFLVPSWLYLLYLAFVIPALGPDINENLFALMNLLAGAFVFLGFVPVVKGWLNQWVWMFLFGGPMTIYMGYVLLLTGD